MKNEKENSLAEDILNQINNVHQLIAMGLWTKAAHDTVFGKGSYKKSVKTLEKIKKKNNDNQNP